MAPEERAALVVRRLENFIRKNREAEGGMRFSKWQEMAYEEILKSYYAVERQARIREAAQNSLTRLLLLAAVASMATIGFWSAVVVDRGADGVLGSMAGSAAVVLLAVSATAYRARTRRRQADAARLAEQSGDEPRPERPARPVRPERG